MVEEEEKEIRISRTVLPAPVRAKGFQETADIPITACMRKGIVVLESNKTVTDAAKVMARNKIGSVVVTEKGKAVGIITERDIVRKVVAQGKSPKLALEKAMTTPLKVIEGEKSVREAIALMKKYGVKRLPVLDAQKRLIGIVTETDITRAVPGMIDVVAELARVRPWEPGAEGVGTCGKCGTWSETLINVNGELLCEECREEEAERE